MLKFGTAAVTEPFSFLDETSAWSALMLNWRCDREEFGMQLEIINMEFGEMIPALKEGRVDMIGACITITQERALEVLFSEPYYTGGIAALVRE